VNIGKDYLDSIKKGQYEHKSAAIKMFLTAPVLLVPESLFIPGKTCIVIDTGSLKMDSHLIKYDPRTNYKQVMNAKDTYDHYEAVLENLQIAVLEKGLTSIQDYKRGAGLPLIKDFTATFSFFNNLENKHPVFPAAEACLVLQNIEI